MARRKPDPGPTPPAGLSDAAASWWRSTRDEYDISDSAGLALLEQAARAMDRAAQARDLLARDGMTVTDRFGQPKAHPMTTVVRDAESSFRSALAALRLDAEPARPVGRPPGGS